MTKLKSIVGVIIAFVGTLMIVTGNNWGLTLLITGLVMIR